MRTETTTRVGDVDEENEAVVFKNRNVGDGVGKCVAVGRFVGTLVGRKLGEQVGDATGDGEFG